MRDLHRFRSPAHLRNTQQPPHFWQWQRENLELTGAWNRFGATQGLGKTKQARGINLWPAKMLGRRGWIRTNDLRVMRTIWTLFKRCRFPQSTCYVHFCSQHLSSSSAPVRLRLYIMRTSTLLPPCFAFMWRYEDADKGATLLRQRCDKGVDS